MADPAKTTVEDQNNPVMWNPWNKVVQDHRDGTIDHEKTNIERAKRDLPIPWTPEIGLTEINDPAID